MLLTTIALGIPALVDFSLCLTVHVHSTASLKHNPLSSLASSRARADNVNYVPILFLIEIELVRGGGLCSLAGLAGRGCNNVSLIDWMKTGGASGRCGTTMGEIYGTRGMQIVRDC